MASRTLTDAVRVFATLDTEAQVQVLRRADGGYGSSATETVLGHLAGMHPDRYAALMAAMSREGLS